MLNLVEHEELTDCIQVAEDVARGARRDRALARDLVLSLRVEGRQRVQRAHQHVLRVLRREDRLRLALRQRLLVGRRHSERQELRED